MFERSDLTLLVLGERGTWAWSQPNTRTYMCRFGREVALSSLCPPAHGAQTHQHTLGTATQLLRIISRDYIYALRATCLVYLYTCLPFKHSLCGPQLDETTGIWSRLRYKESVFFSRRTNRSMNTFILRLFYFMFIFHFYHRLTR